MTNQTILSLLNHLSHEARNSVHAGLGRTLRPTAVPDLYWQTCLENCKSSVDRLLSYIDDIRELLSPDPPASPLAEELAKEFDVTLCLGEIIELLNLASGDRTNRLILQAPAVSLVGRQHRCAVEDALRRILDTVLKLGPKGNVRVTAAPARDASGVRLELVPANSPAEPHNSAANPTNTNIASRVAAWLNANPEHVSLQSADDLLYGLATMVAGKRLRALGGSAEFIFNTGAPAALAISIPWQAGADEDNQPEPPLPDHTSLSVLVAEDCDESFLLTGILLQKEFVCRARNGLEALMMMKERRFDVVLMDIHMPGLDGYQTIQSMRDWEKQTGNARTPIVVLSSDDLDTQMRSAQAGSSGYLRKPLDNYDLLELLDRLKSVRAFSA